MNETRTLVKFIAEMKYDDLSPEARATARLSVLDTIGVGLFGTQMEWAKMVAEMVAEASCAGQSTVWGRKLTTSPQFAALANATAAHGIEMDDLKPPYRVHAGSVAVPAALALAEKAGADGKKLITAVVAGYEAAFRVSRSVRKQMERGIHSPGHFAIWGAVGAASKALDLNEEQGKRSRASRISPETWASRSRLWSGRRSCTRPGAARTWPSRQPTTSKPGIMSTRRTSRR